MIRFARETNIFNLILAYRSRGHLFANISPVREREKYTPPISLERFHLNEEDLEVTFNAGAEIGLGKATLAQIIEYFWRLLILQQRKIRNKFHYRIDFTLYFKCRRVRGHAQ